MDAAREVARRGVKTPYLQRLLNAQSLLRQRRRDEGIPYDPALLQDLKQAVRGTYEGRIEALSVRWPPMAQWQLGALGGVGIAGFRR